MEISVDGKMVEVNIKSTVFDALEAARINPETVLVKRKGALIPHDERLEGNDALELVSVVSRG